MADLIEIHARAENGRVSFELPSDHPELANAPLRLIVSPVPAASTPVGQTDWKKLAAAYADFAGHDPYPDITDPVAWQRQLRAEDEREFDR